MSKGSLKAKSADFARRIVKLCRYLNEKKREQVISRQLFKSGTSVGANIAEAGRAESTADFVHKLGISLKEAEESLYWLELLTGSGILTKVQTGSLIAENKELLAMLTASIKTCKVRLKRSA